jgi:twitching motility protein PilT
MIAFRAAESGFVATFRILIAEVPGLDKIGEGAMPLMEKIIDAHCGLVLIAGPMGSGKVTTASSIIETINATKVARIFAVSGSPFFTFRSKLSMVTQLYVGQDFESYESALEALGHADPDIIAVDDIPNGEALRQTVMLADKGHLVIANLHADSVTDVLRRLFDAARADAFALRRALSQSLYVITVQRLFARASGTGRVPAYEWCFATPAVKNAILHGDLDRVAHLQSSEPESRSLEATLSELVAEGKITEEAAGSYRRE